MLARCCHCAPGDAISMLRWAIQRRSSAMRSIVGTWKMVAAAARDRDGKSLPAPYGGKGMGRVAFDAEGRMMAVTCDGRPVLPPGAPRAYSSYCGNYIFDGLR